MITECMISLVGYVKATNPRTTSLAKERDGWWWVESLSGWGRKGLPEKGLRRF